MSGRLRTVAVATTSTTSVRTSERVSIAEGSPQPSPAGRRCSQMALKRQLSTQLRNSARTPLKPCKMSVERAAQLVNALSMDGVAPEAAHRASKVAHSMMSRDRVMPPGPRGRVPRRSACNLQDVDSVVRARILKQGTDWDGVVELNGVSHEIRVVRSTPTYQITWCKGGESIEDYVSADTMRRKQGGELGLEAGGTCDLYYFPMTTFRAPDEAIDGTLSALTVRSLKLSGAKLEFLRAIVTLALADVSLALGVFSNDASNGEGLLRCARACLDV